MRFTATLDLRTETATTISVPSDVIGALGAGKRPFVVATVNGHSWSATIAIMAGAFLLPVSADVRAAAGIAAGDKVDVDIVVDDAPREVAVPGDLRLALDAAGAAGGHFDRLSEGTRRRLVSQIEASKSAETRQRRITKTVDLVREGIEQ